MKPAPAAARDDLVVPFLLEAGAIRGRLVRLGPTVDWILTRHDYPRPVAKVLGETVALAVVLAGALDFEGVFSLQVKGDGPVKLVAVDVTSGGEVRGMASYDGAGLEAAAASGALVPRLLGQGFMAFTVDQGLESDLHQGIVELSGATIADCAHAYFRQSEQIDCLIQLAADRPGAEGPGAPWRAGALMIQHLPPEGGARARAGAESEEDWRRGAILAASLAPAELLDRRLAPETILWRLFHQEGVRAFPPDPVKPQCRCTRERVLSMLRSFSSSEIEDMRVDGRIVVTCEFCGSVLAFDVEDLDRLLRS
ncbi:MAG: Hsp33 family molecular chaperone HslO [Proteobacteria bacterium]|nr:Hsp33 family molecular chaperone HslO [Pseudomonadota bacterium]